MLKIQLVTRRNFAVGFFVFAILAAAFLFSPSQIFAQDLGMEYAANTGLAQSPESDIRVFIVNIVRYLLTFVGIIAVVMIMYSGFMWMTSEGSPDKIEKAKKILINSAIGLIIIISAFAIVTFIINIMGGGTGSGTLEMGSGPVDLGRGYGTVGSCTVESVYPEPNQKDVARNTSITVTFKEAVDQATIINGAGEIIPENVHLFITSSGDGCDAGDCSTNVTEVSAVTSDNMTFVFTPLNYLGSPSEFINYTIYFSNSITKAAGGGIFDTCSRDYLEWQFEVSNRIDLTPPQVKNGGVFPGPDNAKDDTNITAASVASGLISVLSAPQRHIQAVYGAPTIISGPATPSATISNENLELAQSGTLTLAVNTSATHVALSNGATNLGQAPIISNSATFPGFFTFNIDPALPIASGNSWEIIITRAVPGDTLTIGSQTYTIGSAANTPPDQINFNVNPATMAANIRDFINSESSLPVSATVIGNQVTVNADVAGNAGNNIDLRSSSSTSLSITPMSGGAPAGRSSTIQDVKDKARNAIIKINFNEAVNPMTISGSSADVESVIKVVNIDTGATIAGNFVVSNQYRTVEFIPDTLCGTNACGENIYCLPGDTHLRVDLKASALANCPGEIDCSTKSPYTNCNAGHCQNSTNVNYPMSTPSANGVIDMANNSLDGDRSDTAEGPLSYFNQNDIAAGGGDSYQWSFYISDEIDLGAPVILSTGPTASGTDASLTEPVTATFGELMMSSSLRTGSTQVFNGRDYTEHKLVNIWNFTGGALGYWVGSNDIDVDPVDGVADRTVVQISHSRFRQSMSYRTQIGSGVKDIYQNCFKPSEGPACPGAPGANDVSCCSGVWSTAERCD